MPDYTRFSWAQRRERWPIYADLIPQPPIDVLWKSGEDYHYKLEELRWLPPAHAEVILRICEARYQSDAVLDQSWLNALTEEELNEDLLNLWRPCEGCVPHSEAFDGVQLTSSITEKFFTPLQVACDMAMVFWNARYPNLMIPSPQPFPIVQASCEDVTRYVVADWNRHTQYLQGRDKAWVFKWTSMTSLSSWVLACMLRIVQVFAVMRRVNEDSLGAIQAEPRYRRGANNELILNAQ